MTERDRVYLCHIRDCIMAIKDYTEDGKDLFLSSRLHQDAVIRNFEIIGEASAHLSAEIRAGDAVPWPRIKALRNFLIHQYMGVTPSLVWEVIVNDLPDLEAHVRRLLGE